ncbi:hypothetical protein A471_20319 [Ectopseudomonas mendocina DLHK]|nr:hypothetical protein A471_20319 [Pseudomonas mendocina DLHK]
MKVIKALARWRWRA